MTERNCNKPELPERNDADLFRYTHNRAVELVQISKNREQVQALLMDGGRVYPAVTDLHQRLDGTADIQSSSFRRNAFQIRVEMNLPYDSDQRTYADCVVMDEGGVFATAMLVQIDVCTGPRNADRGLPNGSTSITYQLMRAGNVRAEDKGKWRGVSDYELAALNDALVSAEPY